MNLLMLLSVIHSPLSILNFLKSLAALAEASFENRSLLRCPLKGKSYIHTYLKQLILVNCTCFYSSHLFNS